MKEVCSNYSEDPLNRWQDGLGVGEGMPAVGSNGTWAPRSRAPVSLWQVPMSS